jgi:hypothetical protein
LLSNDEIEGKVAHWQGLLQISPMTGSDLYMADLPAAMAGLAIRGTARLAIFSH